MESILFPTTDLPAGARRKSDYVAFMSDIARASNDAASALSLFANLVEGTAGGSDSAGFMAFDAHGGDTGCQLRAGMMQEVFTLHRQLFDNMTGTWATVRSQIQETTAKLRLVHENATHACMRLVRDKVHPNKLGLATTQDTPENMLRVLGWDAGFGHLSLDNVLNEMLMRQTGEVIGTFPNIHQHLSAMEKISTDGRHSPSTGLTESDNTTLASATSTERNRRWSSIKSSSSSSEDLRPLRMNFQQEAEFQNLSGSNTRIQACVEPTVLLATKWDPLCFRTLARFIVFCYILSKYKSFTVLQGNVGATLAVDDAAETSYSFVRPYTDVKKKAGKPQRILREFAEMQNWLTDLSCAWQRSLAQRSTQAPDIERLLMKTLQQSDKGSFAMACYPGYLLARESWAFMKCTLLIIDRYFCNEGGFHYNIFTATMQPPSSACPCHKHPLGLRVHWLIARIGLHDLIHDDESIWPNLVIMGNSIDGGHDDYMQRIATKARSHSCPADEPCINNEAHIAKILSADHDRLALSFFALHKAYAFPVSSTHCKDDEIAFVEQCIETWVEDACADEERKGFVAAASLKESWRVSREEADAMGTGSGNMRTFAWQHAFLETRGRVARRLQEWIKSSELMPLNAPKHLL